MHKFRRLLQQNDGITTVEFALIAPVLVMLIMGIVEVALIMFTTAVMESATGSTARYGKTGYVASGSTREEQIINNIVTHTQSLLNPDAFIISTLVYENFADIGQQEPYIDQNSNDTYDVGEPYTDSNGNGQWDLDMGVVGLGKGGDIVVYTITYPWTILTPVGQAFFGQTINLQTRTVVQNEPY